MTLIKTVAIIFGAILGISLIIIGIVLLIDYLKNPARKLSDEQKYFIGDKVISLSPRKGYRKLELFVECDPYEHIGRSNGYASYKDNQIRIYNDRDEYIGMSEYDYDVVNNIKNEGNKVHAYFFVAIKTSGYKYGMVCIEFDKSLVRVRNKPYPTISWKKYKRDYPVL